MLKLLTFPGSDDDGNIFVRAIVPSEGLTKQASAEYHPDISKFVGGLKSDPKHLYVLVNALGAGEYYGSNINGDYFEESELKPTEQGTNAGYKTFLDSGVYRHHKNKDINRSMGKVVCSCYNDVMHRVELIIRFERSKAEAEGHGDLIRSLDSGRHPAVSMGCKVKYDVCSICGHKSKTRADYCIHTKNMMGKILPDGRKVFVYNPRPRFFDISFVVVGADRTSYAMAKVAYINSTTSSAEMAEREGLEDTTPLIDEQIKLASSAKLANILKRIPAMSAKLMPALEASEKPLGSSVLSRLSRHPMDRVMTTAASSGIVLRPREFQRIMLIRIGKPRLADRLDGAGHLFPPTSGVDRSFSIGSPSQFSPDIMSILRPLIQDRGILGPQMNRRVMVIRRNPRPVAMKITLIKRASVAAPVLSGEEKELLNKISEGYNSYRLQLLEKMGSIVENITCRDTRLLSTIEESKLEDAFTGSGFSKEATLLPAALASALPMAYLYGAHVRGKRGTGQQVGPLEGFVERHPILATSIFLGLSKFGLHMKNTGMLDKLLADVTAKI